MTLIRGTALITGAASGFGFQTAAALATTRHQIVVTGRDEEAGRLAVEDLRRWAGHDEIRFVSVDHSVVGDSLRLADWISARFDRLDILVNNVGAGPADRWCMRLVLR